MKFIISHDVDHLFGDDHLCDLIYPKLWVRESLNILTGKIPVKDWYYRMLSPFQKVRHNIDAVMAFDKEYNVPSSFFFGMANGLGMSYKKEKAFPMIHKVHDNGFDVGVHGISYNDETAMHEEYNCFKEIGVLDSFGVREHYVRFDDTTFNSLSNVGYIFDSSEFDKQAGYLLKNPYKVGNIWEFPLAIMDGYLPYKFEDAKHKTLEILKEAEDKKIEYVCVLFHDYLFCLAYAASRDWYKWLIGYISENYTFVSYRDAIKELEVK